MQASLALSRGTLFVGVHAKTAHVHSFDLGGRPLGTSFSFRDAGAGRSAVAGLALDDDRTLWIADTPAGRVRQFSLFGREVGGLGAPSERGVEVAPLLPGLVVRPVDVEVQGNRDQGWLAIACAGEHRHAVQLFDLDFSYRASCAALGDPQRAFRGVCRLAAEGERLYVAEALARNVQVFRAGEFLFAFQLTTRTGERLEPSALAPLADGRIVVGCRAPHSVLMLVDGAGRPLRVLAQEGLEEGQVLEPSDVVVERGSDDRQARLFVIDRDGLRVQAFTLEGRCLGAIPFASAAPATRRKNKGGR
ncbi:MAG: hypothetical protein HOP15_04350 [Planctomycetes bacterium]|nr:hypothetical protein [Planctomycetota bacterium]